MPPPPSDSKMTHSLEQLFFGTQCLKPLFRYKYCQYCQILPNIAKYCQNLPNIAKYCQILPNIAKYCQTLPNNAKHCQTLPDITKDCQILPNIAKSYGSGDCIPKCSSMLKFSLMSLMVRFLRKLFVSFLMLELGMSFWCELL